MLLNTNPADRKQSCTAAPCPIRSDCRREADKKFFTGLFDKEWEVFVIRHDEVAKKYDWFTLCCDAAEPIRTAPRRA